MNKKELNLQIGVNIAKIRKRFGFTQEQLAECLGISKSFLAHVEQGDTQFSVDNLWNFANTLHVSADEVLFGTTEESQILSMLNAKNLDSLDTICSVLHLIADHQQTSSNEHEN